ncbi:MAG: Ig-like domain-containing protein [Anaerolineae bacterium]
MMKRRMFLTVTAILLALALVACDQSTQGPQAWLDRPLDNSTVPQQPLTIQAHASDADGVASIEFFVNEARLSTVAVGGGRLGEAAMEWRPPLPGTYLVQARAVDNNGNYGPDAISFVIVSGESAELPTETPTSTPTPTLTPGILSVTPTPTLTPHPLTPTPTSTLTPQPLTPTPTSTLTPYPPTPTPTNTPLSPVQVRFTADSTSLKAGECTMLRWDVEHATAVFLNGQDVEGHGSRQVCPAGTTTYALYVQAPAGDVEQSIKINVTAPPTATPTPTLSPVPPDTTPPNIVSVGVAPDLILTEGPGCPGYERTVTVAAAVGDESGIGSVWATWSVGGENGQVTLTLGQLGYWAKIGPVHTTGTMTIYVFARDTVVGNPPAQAGPLYVNVQDCIK